MTLIDADGLLEICPFYDTGVKLVPTIEAVPCDFIRECAEKPENAGYYSAALSRLLKEYKEYKRNGDLDESNT